MNEQANLYLANTFTISTYTKYEQSREHCGPSSHLEPNSKSLASLIFIARYSEPPVSGWFNLDIVR